MANAITSALPRTEKNQNAGRGRSPPRSTAKAAVESGSRPRKTMECAEVTCCKANAVNNGNPSTTPIATSSSENSWLRSGRLALSASRMHSASTPAMVARAKVRKTGLNSCTATRVAGNEALKMTTPIKPLIQPERFFSVAGECKLEVRSIGSHAQG